MPPTASPLAAPLTDDWQLLARSLDPTEATLLCNCLHAAGITASAGDTNIVQTHSLLSLAIGGACVRVPGDQLAQAQEVMAALQRGEFALGDDFDPG